MKTVAIVLAAGKGRRMGGKVPKQYLELGGKPVIYYSLKTFEESFIDEVVLVCTEGEEEYCRKEIVIKYGFSKVVKIVAGGRERFNSVYNGLMASNGCDYVFIHDGARPFVTQHVLDRCLHYVEKYRAAVAAVPAKDTVKLENGDGFIKTTPDRSLVWLMQTPQVFDFHLIRDSYEKLTDQEERLRSAGVTVTDDTMVAKMFADVDAKLVESTYFNIKITTPEDLILAEAILQSGQVDK
ncbi:MAG: 2-C-methyl-D-erythritol 4-phosphate cytidylyltransferase [Lachnospiraceae bacterium]|nr:2-C-methyl-D-erythritol 4-phosphate cytidylyltransferase [Lachnospiraceae bacterium]